MVISSVGKMQIPFTQALFRGIMCNILICLGYWIVSKTKSETAKLIIILWVIAGLITSGYEHSIANAGIFTMAFFAPMTIPGLVSSGIWANLIPVTLGNLIGGAFFVALPYWFSGCETSSKTRND